MKSDLDVVRFWAKVQRPVSGCWLWIGRRYWDSYGEFRLLDGRRIAAHKFSWELANGRTVAEGLEVCHTCDVRPCVNPEHLFEGTHTENVHDMIAKGRAVLPPPRSGSAALAVLTESQVVSVRHRVAAGERYADLARELGVSYTAVRDAATGRRWTHLGGPVAPKKRGAGYRRHKTAAGECWCSGCKAAKPNADFYSSVVAKGRGWCRVCQAAYDARRASVGMVLCADANSDSRFGTDDLGLREAAGSHPTGGEEGD